MFLKQPCFRSLHLVLEAKKNLFLNVILRKTNDPLRHKRLCTIIKSINIKLQKYDAHN
jgi:hypothetical protein